MGAGECVQSGGNGIYRRGVRVRESGVPWKGPECGWDLDEGGRERGRGVGGVR